MTWPVKYVYAKSDSPEDILDAIVKGLTTIGFDVGTAFIDIVSGDAVLGDTVKLTDKTEVTIKVKKLNRKLKKIVFDNNGVCFG